MEPEDTDQAVSRTSAGGPRRWPWAALTTAVIALVIGTAACGAGSPSGSSDPSSPVGPGSAGFTGRVASYAECMRAHGVPNYPDSLAIGGTGINPSSQAFLSAEAKCYRLSPIASISTHATDQQVRQALETTACMRDHGVPNFPDPIVTSTPPTRPSAAPASSGGGPGYSGGGPGYSETYSNGILFKISNSIVNSSPFQAAANACNFKMPGNG